MKRKFKIGQHVKVILSNKDARKYASPLLCIEDMLSSPGFTQEMFDTIGKTGIVVERIEGFPRVKFETGEEWNYLDAWLADAYPKAKIKVEVGGVYNLSGGGGVVIVADKRTHAKLYSGKHPFVGVEIGTGNVLCFSKKGKCPDKVKNIEAQVQV